MSDDDDDDPQKKTREALWQRVAVGAFSGILWLVSILPTWLAYAIGDALAVLWFLWWSLQDRRGRRHEEEDEEEEERDDDFGVLGRDI